MKLKHSRLVEVLDYDPESGVFRWLISTSNRVKVGAVAGRDNGNGYIRICIDGKNYYAHRLAWFYSHGVWPEKEIDHRNGNGMKNWLSNLRPATHAQNGQNQPLRSTNTSGFTGVSWSKLHEKWESYIWVNCKKVHLGLFRKIENAKKAYLAAKQGLHKFQPVPRDML